MPEAKKKSNTLCIISLIFMFVVPILFSLLFRGNGDISGSTSSAFSWTFRITSVSHITAWVFAIVSRVKYKEKFSLVLLIIYGSLLALAAIAFFVMIFFIIGAISIF